MKIIGLDGLFEHKDTFLDQARNGAVFFYPTDTIYGLGGVVSDTVIDRINQIKQRPEGKYYSVIAPSVARVEQECAVVSDFGTYWCELKETVNGGLTVLCPLREESAYRRWYDNGLIGVRFIDHPFQKFVEALGEPLITTSANVSGEEPVRSVSGLTVGQQGLIDRAVDAGVIAGSASTVVEYESGKVIR